MSDEIPIGPNRCHYCGGEYGIHQSDCRKRQSGWVGPTDSPKVLFESLPEPLQRQYYHHSGVHMHVSAYIHGKIAREQMLEMLCAYLADENTRSMGMLVNYARWFGSPPPLLPK